MNTSVTNNFPAESSNGFENSLTASKWSEKFSQYYPWVIIGFCSLFLFFKYVLQVSPSVMTHDLMEVFHVNGAGLGNLAATYFYAYFVTQLFAGPLLDRYSPKYLTALAIGTCALGAFLFAHTSLLFHAQLSRALMGMGTAFATVSYMKMSALWFRPNQVAFVDGLLATAAMTGALCGQVPLTLLVHHAGWRHSLDYCGLFGLLLTVLFLLFVKEKNAPSTTNGELNKPKTVSVMDLLSLLKTKKNWLLTFYSGLAFTPLAVLGGLWGNPFFEEAHHLTVTQAASFTSCMFLGLAVGGPFFGLLADRWGNRMNVMMLGTSLALVSLLAALYLSSLPLWLFGVALFLFGLGTGSFMSCFAVGKEMNSVRLAASVVALVNTGDALFGSFTEPLVGKLLDLFWKGKVVHGVHYFSPHDFHLAFVLLPLYLVGALVCLLALKKGSK